MAKPTIFLSHISEEAELAFVFKDQIEESFLGLVDVFVSSSPKSITLGSNWLEKLTEGLRGCAAMIILCSEPSTGRPWINFEAGAGWARAIDIVPICHSGLRPVDLPLPLSLLQGVTASDKEKIEGVFAMIAAKLGATKPSFDVEAFITKVVAFETEYQVAIRIGAHLRGLRARSKELFNTMAQVPPNYSTAIQGLPERVFIACEPHLKELQNVGELEFRFDFVGISFGPSGGGTGNLTVKLSDRLVTAIKQEQ